MDFFFEKKGEMSCSVFSCVWRKSIETDGERRGEGRAFLKREDEKSFREFKIETLSSNFFLWIHL